MNKPISLLIVDDNPQFLNTICEYIQDHLCDDIHICGTAMDGNQAIELVKEQQPDFVLLDMKMPQMHGFDVIPLLRQNQISIKIILTTLISPDIYAENVNVYENSSRYAGANAFIPKSHLTTMLVPLIDAIVGQTNMRFISLERL